jgi:MSHA pilin protein MshA
MFSRQQRGFTLIELVVVIVILGILAAFAVPRFMGMEGEARAATVKNLGGSLRSAAALARAKCQAQGCGSAGNVVIEGQSVTMVNGYPNRDTIERTLQGVVDQGWTLSSHGNGRRFSKVGAGANCWVQYNQAANANTAPTISFQSGTIGVGTATEQSIAVALATACQ